MAYSSKLTSTTSFFNYYLKGWYLIIFLSLYLNEFLFVYNIQFCVYRTLSYASSNVAFWYIVFLSLNHVPKKILSTCFNLSC